MGVLEDYGVIRAQGADAARFLQGQLSNDITRVRSGGWTLAGLHNPQGRTVALLRLTLQSADNILAILPRELAANVTTRLARFVLRAKVKITNESDAWRVVGLTRLAAEQLPPSAVHGAWGDGERTVALVPRDEADLAPIDREAWRLQDIQQGIAQVYAATSEAFVAQMLNLDTLGGISFEKGCYTGQEVIARAHYRGKVKRRMQRFRSASPASLHAGDAGVLNDGRSFKVIDAVSLEDGRSEFLAVAPLVAGVRDEDSAAATDAPTPLPAEQLPLPYSLEAG